jgi:hypothetical protein
VWCCAELEVLELFSGEVFRRGKLLAAETFLVDAARFLELQPDRNLRFLAHDTLENG